MLNNFRSIKEHLADRDYINRKPYRNAAQKADARRLAKMADGRWVSSAAVTRHAPERGR
jgi:hypothetical protein